MQKDARIFILLSLTIPWLLNGCGERIPRHAARQFFYMSTSVDVTVVTGLSNAALSGMWNSLDSLLARWDGRYSQSGPRSVVRAFNADLSRAVAVPAEFGGMLADALAWGDSTGGGFDATILPVKELWGLCEGCSAADRRRPSEKEIADAVRKVDYRKIMISPGRDTVYRNDTSVAVDAGGFAKVYALIEVSKILDARGFRDYLIASGDIIVRGRRCDGKQWRIGIQHPRARKLLAIVSIDSGSVFTSGDYENFWMDGDRRVHHIFDPATGRSCTRNQSVTIFSRSPVVAKYLSTGLFCLPADSIVSYAERRGLDCVVVDSSGRASVSRGWKDRISFQ